MSKFSKTWWGKRFIEALESFTDSGRLSRGRSYANNGKIKEYKITKGKITAKVRGSVNPYFGVYKEPLYKTEISLTPISEKNWKDAIALLSSQASFVSKLLMNEMPDNIEEVFYKKLKLHLLPYDRDDFETNCSCPDWSNPCKHIAGVYYLIASEIDQDPFLLFELRGLKKEKLHQELMRSPLGQILSQGLSTENLAPEPAESYYTKPILVKANNNINQKKFWQGEKRIPEHLPDNSPNTIPAIVIKKAGDYPPFWHQDNSFIELMSNFYTRVRKTF
ncbi:SWIM zinc finger family protein [Cyanobacterium aponinum FACHB-4101]|uniref:SWIM zinc finger family protein n=1 Tax=Cyanobacterium aponinum TaxID=379064 RepID=UPI00168132D2|nr:SWIM zinc finger family protein [Cyanobacterium aponinum]MBD2394626.1 SWIM zinc finger family protein [Cyanobacterium aponinum FACHB-4101]